jgi:FkbM family methyltransferase
MARGFWPPPGLKKATRLSRYFLGSLKARKLGLARFLPNYIYVRAFDASSVVIDVGCGFGAEFSRHMITKYGARAFGVDPTHRHAPALAKIEAKMAGRFTHLPLAVSAAAGTITFHESLGHESGSLLDDHLYVQHDKLRTYQVESVTLTGLRERTGFQAIDCVKLDLEGAEYELLQAATKEELAPFRQIFVEFHHDTVERYTARDTEAMAARIAGMGFRPISVDGRNYLFVHPSLAGRCPRP